MSGAVSARLRFTLTRALDARSVQIWLDPAGTFTAFADALAADPEWSTPVARYRGSFLAVLRETQPLTEAEHPPRLLIHAAGLRDAQLRASPLCDLRELDQSAVLTLTVPELVRAAVVGMVPDAEVDAFLAPGGISLAAADAWVARQLQTDASAHTAALQGQPPARLVEALLTGAGVAEGAAGSEARMAALRHSVALHTGVDDAFFERLAVPTDARLTPVDLGEAALAWAMWVEYVDDLDGAPATDWLAPLKKLPAAQRRACREICEAERRRDADGYARVALATEEMGPAEKTVAPDRLGQVDTFPFEEDRLLRAAIRGLQGAAPHANVVAAATARAGGASFWAGRPERHGVWLLLDHALTLRGLLDEAKAPPPRVAALEDYADLYATQWAPIDRAHRRLEQARLSLDAWTPEYERVRAALDHLRQRWFAWADPLNRRFADAVDALGPLPDPNRRQRHIFEREVRPLLERSRGGTVVYFMVDALRYEMALDLMADFAGPAGVVATLRPWLAELPTETKVGMNALAPVAEGERLRPDIKGRKIEGLRHRDTFTVSRPEDRHRVIREAAGDPHCVQLSLVDAAEGLSLDDLRAHLSRAQLLIVHSQEIDLAGETGLGTGSFEPTLRKLRTAWARLRQAGARKLVVTADHGFLMLPGIEQKTRFGTLRDPQRRYVLRGEPDVVEGTLSVPLRALEYAGTEGVYLVVPRGLDVFDRGKKNDDFVHGGNSLQERVIPVLTVTHRNARGVPQDLGPLRVAVRVDRREPVQNWLRVSLFAEVVQAEQLAIGAATAETVDLRLVTTDDSPATVQVEQVNGGERDVDVVRVRLGQACEVFFRLLSDQAGRTRVGVELLGPEHQLEGVARSREWFDYQITQQVREKKAGEAAAEVAAPAPSESVEEVVSNWLAEFTDRGVRRVFEHLKLHGVVTEAEAAEMLGSARAQRRFTLNLDTYAELAPFRVTVDASGGMKRYVKADKE